MRFTGKLLRGDQIIVDHATGDIWQKVTPAGIRAWGGHFDPNPGFDASGELELLLDDGRHGPVAIDAESISRHHPTAVRFRGCDLLRWHRHPDHPAGDNTPP